MPAQPRRWTAGSIVRLLTSVTAVAFAAAACSVSGDAEGPPLRRSPSFFAEIDGIFTANCSGCHSAGSRAPDLLDHRVLDRLTDEAFHTVIMTGAPGKGMPAFGATISEQQGWQMITYLRFMAENRRQKPVFVADPTGQVIDSDDQRFRIDVLATGLETPWGLAFIPDGRMLVTERPGRLRIVQGSQLLDAPVRGTPKVWERQDAGLLDVAVHPDYANNGWIYLAYSEALPAEAGGTEAETTSPPSMTVIVRGRLGPNNNWTSEETIFRAPAQFYSVNDSHYGTRMAFDSEGHLFFSIGEKGNLNAAQDLTSPLGKIHRVMADGSVPADNPFVGRTDGALPTIWSFGHRNPQGFAWANSGMLWSSEHGPLGGDEINIIERGGNYGWGVATFGTQPGITLRSAPGMIDPVVSYTPAIAPSGITILQGDQYPRWKGDMFVAALGGQQLRRLKIDGRQVIGQEVLFDHFGRVRTVAEGPDGLLYVLLQNPTGADTGHSLSSSTPGILIKLTPVGQ
jgi:glucose/arabinose dehydrogenase